MESRIRSVQFLLTMAVAMAATFPQVVTADMGFSVSLGANHSTADNVPLGFFVPEVPNSLDPEGNFSGTGLRATASVAWRGWAGFEVGWSRFGTATRRAFDAVGCPGGCVPPDIPEAIEYPVEQTGSAAWAALKPTLKRENWEVYAKLGTGRTERQSRRTTDPGNRERETDSGLMLGAGAAIYWSHGFGVRADFERFGGHAQQYGVSLTFEF